MLIMKSPNAPKEAPQVRLLASGKSLKVIVQQELPVNDNFIVKANQPIQVVNSTHKVFVLENVAIADNLTSALHREIKTMHGEVLEAHTHMHEDVQDAADSAAAAFTHKNAAEQYKNAAKVSETNSKASELASKQSETNSAASATTATQKATVSTTNAANALGSEQRAKASETAAKASESQAGLSKDAARLSQEKALVSEQRSKVSETNSKNSEVKAKESETITITNRTHVDAQVPIVDGYRNEALASKTEATNQARISTEKAIAANNSADSAALSEERSQQSAVASEVSNKSSEEWAKKAQEYANQTFISGGLHNPSMGQEYPDVSDITRDTLWIIDLTHVLYVDGLPTYTFTGGSLAGRIVRTGMQLFFDTPSRTWHLIDTVAVGVTSVNGQTGVVTVTPEGIGAYPLTGGSISGSIQVNGGSVASMSPNSATHNAHFWLKRSNGSNAGLLLWERGSQNIHLRRYSTSSALESEIVLQNDRIHTNKFYTQDAAQSSLANALTRKDWVDGNFVNLAGAQTITGVKTFTEMPILPIGKYLNLGGKGTLYRYPATGTSLEYATYIRGGKNKGDAGLAIAFGSDDNLPLAQISNRGSILAEGSVISKAAQSSEGNSLTRRDWVEGYFTRRGHSLLASDKVQMWENSYVVSNTKIAKLTLPDGSELSASGVYKCTATTTATGTPTGTIAYLLNNNGTWIIRYVSGSIGSNYPEFVLQDGKPAIKTRHGNDYTVNVITEMITSSNTNVAYSMLGLFDTFHATTAGGPITYKGNPLYHGGNKPTWTDVGGLDYIKEVDGRYQVGAGKWLKAGDSDYAGFLPSIEATGSAAKNYLGASTWWFKEAWVNTYRGGSVNVTGAVVGGNASLFKSSGTGNGTMFGADGVSHRALVGVSTTAGEYLFGGNSAGATGFDCYLRVSDTGKLEYTHGNTVNTVYHSGNKPTAADVGAVSKTGDVMSARLTIGVSGGTTGFPNATPRDVNNYINKALFRTNVSNNGLHFFGDDRGNARRMGIQSGHADSAYANAYGYLELNPFGGDVRANGHKVYSVGYKPTAADVKALPITGGTVTGAVTVDSLYSVNRVSARGIGNDYHQGAFEARGNGTANTVFPTIGFHQPGVYAASLQLRAGKDFRFYAQGGTSYAGVTASTFNASGTAANEGITFNGKTAIGGSNDAWLRINPHSQFSSGIYCGSTGVLRHDNEITAGAWVNNNRTSRLKPVFYDSSWGGNGVAGLSVLNQDTSGAHWMLASYYDTNNIRAGIQVLSNSDGRMRFYTNRRSNYVEVYAGNAFAGAAQATSGNAYTRKDYVDGRSYTKAEGDSKYYHSGNKPTPAAIGAQSKIHHGTGVPSPSLGVDGDVYIQYV